MLLFTFQQLHKLLINHVAQSKDITYKQMVYIKQILY